MRSKYLVYGILLLAIIGIIVFVIVRILPAEPTLLKIEANPAKGFYWPYYLYIPGRVWTGENGQTYLLVEPNNSPPSDNQSVHDEWARKRIESTGAEMAEDLRVAVLIPTFPRPETPKLSAAGIDNETWTYSLVTQALTREALLTEIEGLERIDLQLIAMIDDARERLWREGINADEKVLMMGYSSSGYFTNRFILLHPERVWAAVMGGVGGWVTVPLKEWNGVKLRYPIGVSDLEILVGKEFDLESFRIIPLYIFVGDQDTNDPVPKVDMYDTEDARLILQNFGESMAERWQVGERMYESAESKAHFVRYPGVDHEQTEYKLWGDDVKAFFSEQMARSSE